MYIRKIKSLERKDNDPTEEQIRERCLEVQTKWDERTRDQRERACPGLPMRRNPPMTIPKASLGEVGIVMMDTKFLCEEFEEGG